MNQSQVPTAADHSVAAETVIGDSSQSDSERILAAAADILRQGELLLASLPPGAFVQKVPVAFNASIGGHYRHSLDHFTSLLGGLDSALVDYDHRQRDSRLETQPDFALALTRRIRAGIECLEPSALWTPMIACCEVSYEQGNSPLSKSSLGRELVYVIAHAIHHYALISVMARILEVPLPPAFGVAPSTVAHLQSTGSR